MMVGSSLSRHYNQNQKSNQYRVFLTSVSRPEGHVGDVSRDHRTPSQSSIRTGWGKWDQENIYNSIQF